MIHWVDDKYILRDWDLDYLEPSKREYYKKLKSKFLEILDDISIESFLDYVFCNSRDINDIMDEIIDNINFDEDIEDE